MIYNLLKYEEKQTSAFYFVLLWRFAAAGDLFGICFVISHLKRIVAMFDIVDIFEKL